jgi:hypothetical protein
MCACRQVDLLVSPVRLPYFLPSTCGWLCRGVQDDRICVCPPHSSCQEEWLVVNVVDDSAFAMALLPTLSGRARGTRSSGGADV